MAHRRERCRRTPTDGVASCSGEDRRSAGRGKNKTVPERKVPKRKVGIANPRVYGPCGFSAVPESRSDVHVKVGGGESINLAGQVRAKGERFADAFARRGSPKVRAVRQIGLMIGIELKERARPYIEALMARGVLALPAGPTVIRLLPPLVIKARKRQIGSCVSIH